MMIDQVQTTRFANGLTILTEHMPGLRSVSLGIWVRRGSRHETPALNGICHFIEHALFKGSQRRSAREIATESDRLGGHLDAYTSHEITGFALKVVDTALPLAFDLLADMLANPRFDPDDLTREQGVIIEEMKMIGDTPDELLNELFHAAYFPGHALGRPIEGTEETVSSFDRAITAAFHAVTYSPRNLVIAAAGNVNHAQLTELAEEAFGLGSNESEAASGIEFSPTTAAPILIESKQELEQAHLIIASPWPCLVSSRARAIEQSFFLRRTSSGLSSIVSTSAVWTMRTRWSSRRVLAMAARICASSPTRCSAEIVPQLCSAALTPSMTTSHPWSPPITSTTIRINKSKERRGHNSPSALSDLNSGDRLDCEDLAAFVESTGGTDPVWNEGCGALRAGGQLWQFQDTVIGPAHALTTA